MLLLFIMFPLVGDMSFGNYFGREGGSNGGGANESSYSGGEGGNTAAVGNFNNE